LIDKNFFNLKIAHALAILDTFLVLSILDDSSINDESGIAIDKSNNQYYMYNYKTILIIYVQEDIFLP